MRILFALCLLYCQLLLAPLWADTCPDIARQLRLPEGTSLDLAALAATLSHLNRQGRLPDYFVTKQQARAAGWQPGQALWRTPALQGKSMGSDRFGNFERRLPKGQWHEADLDYRGGKRGPKRLVFEARPEGRRYVTVDHYTTFIEVPPCR